MVADKAQTYCPRLEGLGPWFLRRRNCLDTHELLNNRKERKCNKEFSDMALNFVTFVCFLVKILTLVAALLHQDQCNVT